MRKLFASIALGLVSSGAWLAACSSDDSQNDGGTEPDSSKPDTGVIDTGKSDTTTNDTGTDTGSMPDTGTGTDSGGDGGPGFDFYVVRVGTGQNDASAGSESNPIFLEKRNSSNGALASTIALPIGPNDGGTPITISGQATSEGDLQLSGDTHFLTMGGYAAIPNVASIAGTSSNGADAGVYRVIARVDKNGVVDTTTFFDAFDKNNIRSAATNDGTAFWAAGAVLGTVYVPIGTSTITIVQATKTNTRSANVTAGQLYTSSASGTPHGVYSVGSGLPTTTNQTVTNLANINDSDGGVATSPYSFDLQDLDQQVNGVDTAYVADDSAAQAIDGGVMKGGGVQKFKLSNGTWSLVAIFNDQLTTKGCYHVSAQKVGNDVHVVCSTSDTTTSRLIRYIDNGNTMSPSGTVIANAPAGTFFRGVARVPQ